MKYKNSIGIFTYDFYPWFGGHGRYVYETYYQKLRNTKTCYNWHFFSPCTNDLVHHHSVFKACRKFGKQIFFSFLLQFTIGRWIYKYQLKTIILKCGPGGLYLLKKPRVPLIVVTHHTYLQQIHFIKKQWWKWLFYLLEKRTYRMANSILTCTNKSKIILIEKYGIREDKIDVIPHGVNTNVFKPLCSIKKTDKKFLFVGRLEERKGIYFLLSAIKELIHNDKDITLHIIGEGPLESWIKKYVILHDIQKYVFLYKKLTDEDLNIWYNRVKALIVPSKLEGFGLVIIEAMAARTPVIGTDVDGISSIIRNNYNGYLVRFGDKLNLMKVVESVLNNNQNKIVNTAFKNIKTMYDLDKISTDIFSSISRHFHG